MTSKAGAAPAASRPRRRARELVLQGLYQRQLAGQALAEIRAQLEESHGFARADPGYFDALWQGVGAELEPLLERVVPLLDRPLAALSPIERAILAIGAFELAHRPEIPFRVVINEAVELAKVYGGTDGHKYVNGVLDRLAQQLRSGEGAAGADGRSAVVP